MNGNYALGMRNTGAANIMWNVMGWAGVGSLKLALFLSLCTSKELRIVCKDHVTIR